MNNLNFKTFIFSAILTLTATAGADSLQIQKENEDFYNQLDQIVQNVNPRKNTKWSLSKLSLNTSKNHGGIFGLMPFKGTATATLSWIPKTVSSKTLENDATDIQSFDLSTNSEDASYVATVWYREFLRAKKLPWTTKNEKNFIDLFLKARVIAQEIATVYHPAWYIDQFVVERGLTVKGTLAPLLSLEAAFAVRFSFDLKSVRNAKTNQASELTALVLGLAEDLYSSSKSFNLADWKVEGFNLGLGINPALGVGVVNAKPFAFAHMMFKPRKNAAMMTASLSQEIKSLTTSTMKMFDYSDVQPSSMSVMATAEKPFIIDREKFRGGLAYALGLAKNMTVQADKGDNSGKKWRLGQVVYRFESSVKGGLLFVALKSHVGAEVKLAKQLPAVQEVAPTAFELMDITANNVDMQKALKNELVDNTKILSLVPAGQTLTGIESSASLKFSFGLDSPVASLQLSAIPQVRLKFSPSK